MLSEEGEGDDAKLGPKKDGGIKREERYICYIMGGGALLNGDLKNQLFPPHKLPIILSSSAPFSFALEIYAGRCLYKLLLGKKQNADVCKVGGAKDM